MNWTDHGSLGTASLRSTAAALGFWIAYTVVVVTVWRVDSTYLNGMAAGMGIMASLYSLANILKVWGNLALHQDD